MINKPHKDWYKYVNVIENAINNNVNETTKYKPIDLFYGKINYDKIFELIKFPISKEINTEVFKNQIREEALKNIIKSAKVRLESYKRKNLAKYNYKLNDLVLMKNFVLSSKIKNFVKKLAPAYKGIFKIINVYKNNWYLI